MALSLNGFQKHSNIKSEPLNGSPSLTNRWFGAFNASPKKRLMLVLENKWLRSRMVRAWRTSKFPKFKERLTSHDSPQL